MAKKRVESRKTGQPRNHAARRSRRRPKRGFASWSVGKKIAAILGGTFIVVATACIALVASKLGKIEQTVIDPEKLNITQEVEEQLTGYTNIALFGVDSRTAELGQDTRSDTIMIASINNETQEVKIASIYRDTLLQMEDGTYNKANAAHSFGGPEEAIAMLNRNFDLDITKYVTVNFNSMIAVVDAVGGIEIDVQEDEIPYITGFACEIINATGVDSLGVFEPGVQTLNGVQTTAYARIRKAAGKTSGNDFGRTERQRDVLQKIIAKLQTANLAVLNKIVDEVFPQISTNFTLPEALNYAKHAKKYTLLGTVGFPTQLTTNTLSGLGSVVIPSTLESNVIELHKFLFGEDGYVPSSTVSTISGGVANRASSGVQIDSSESDTYDQEDTSSYNNESDNTSTQQDDTTTETPATDNSTTTPPADTGGTGTEGTVTPSDPAQTGQ
ncbi:MAG: LCP family protein [Lachnospiraceae bacterium]|nr:LCP family protein [Lachnospiraceae bacterium]